MNGWRGGMKKWEKGDNNHDLIKNRWRLKTYRSVFIGKELVDWLIRVGLAHDRSEALRYGRHLLDGRLIRHIRNEHHFHDRPFFYTFQSEESKRRYNGPAL